MQEVRVETRSGSRTVHAAQRKSGASGSETTGSIHVGDFLRDLAFSVEPGGNPFYFAGRVIVFMILFVWDGLSFCPDGFTWCGSSFLHLVNLPFHEAVIFSSDSSDDG